MFENLTRTLRKLERGNLSVPIHAKPDSEGYCDRQCPAPECEFLFKVREDDWVNIVLDEAVWCPFCGHEAPSDHWWTHEQIKRAKQAATEELKHRIGSAMSADAKRFNRRQRRNAFISLTMRFNARPKKFVLPAVASRPMQLKISCEKCACRYAVIGSAFFCPACGQNAADRVFLHSLETISDTLDNLSMIADAVADPDIAENTKRLLVEHSLQSIVTAFQRYAELLFEKHPSPPQKRRNAFQSLETGSRLWKQAFGNGYAAHLETNQLATLQKYFQQRHLLAHRGGLVDAEYIHRSGDTSYKVGQRFVLRPAAVRECLRLVRKLAEGLAGDAS